MEPLHFIVRLKEPRPRGIVWMLNDPHWGPHSEGMGRAAIAAIAIQFNFNGTEGDEG